MTDKHYLLRCLQLAQRAKGYAAPNPMVGAVLVHRERVLAEGWHHAWGGPHAEVDCLNKLTPADRHLLPESTLYVNLEPCAHHGKTPPCAERIVAERIKKVVIANTDPFALVNGKGIQLLQQAGIEVVSGVASAEGRWVNRRFFTFHERQRPYIILKWAQTLDGYLAPANKTRLAITNDQSNVLVHKWRTEEAAILVGSGTALADDPQLTARLWQGRQPLRIVLGNRALPHSSHLADGSTPTWLLGKGNGSNYKNLTHFTLNEDFDALSQVMELLYQHHIQSVIVEGGQQVLGGFIDAGLWDEARIFTGEVTLGGGLAAPRLTQATEAFTIAIANDLLQVFTRRDNGYPWKPGMEL